MFLLRNSYISCMCNEPCRGINTNNDSFVRVFSTNMSQNVSLPTPRPSHHEALPYSRGRGSGTAALPLPLQKATHFCRPYASAPSAEAHLGLFGGGKKSQNKNFNNPIRTIEVALIMKLTVATMEMFSSLENSRTLCEPKSVGAS